MSTVRQYRYPERHTTYIRFAPCLWEIPSMLSALNYQYQVCRCNVFSTHWIDCIKHPLPPNMKSHVCAVILYFIWGMFPNLHFPCEEFGFHNTKHPYYYYYYSNLISAHTNVQELPPSVPHFGISITIKVHILELRALVYNLEFHTQKDPHCGISWTIRSTFWNYTHKKGPQFEIEKCVHFGI